MNQPKNSTATKPRIAWICICSLIVGVLYAGSTFAQSVGTVTDLSGPLLARKADGVVMVLAQHSSVEQGDLLESEKNTYTRIKFIDNSEVTLRPNTQFKIDAFSYDEAKPENDNILVSLIKGGLRSVTGLLGKRNKEKVKFNTPAATIGIRGTNFGALFCQNDCGTVPTASGSVPQNGLYVDVVQGAIVVANPAGSQTFQAGSFGFIANLNTPPIILPPSQGMPVTMPTSITNNPPSGANQSPGNVDCIVR
jgi:hypothetical protein